MKLFKNRDEHLLPYDEIVKIVVREFIAGADKAFLKKIEKTARGGKRPKLLYTKDEKFCLAVFTRPVFLFWLNRRDVSVSTKVENEGGKPKTVIYQMETDKDYPKFYAAVKAEIEKERSK